MIQTCRNKLIGMIKIGDENESGVLAHGSARSWFLKCVLNIY